MNAQGLYSHYRTKDFEVQAVLLRPGNIRDVAVWVAENGGSIAGMTYREQGPLEHRGLRIGTLEGDQIYFGLGDYVVRDVRGTFTRYGPREFHRIFDLVHRAGEEITTTMV